MNCERIDYRWIGRYRAIYRIFNTITGESYVGRTFDMRMRAENHARDLARGGHQCRHLQQSYDKWGPTAFKFQILQDSNRDADERRWASQLPNLFNHPRHLIRPPDSSAA